MRDLSEDEGRLLRRLQDQRHIPIENALETEGITRHRWLRLRLAWTLRGWWDDEAEQLTTLGMRQG